MTCFLQLDSTVYLLPPPNSTIISLEYIHGLIYQLCEFSLIVFEDKVTDKFKIVLNSPGRYAEFNSTTQRIQNLVEKDQSCEHSEAGHLGV